MTPRGVPEESGATDHTGFPAALHSAIAFLSAPGTKRTPHSALCTLHSDIPMPARRTATFTESVIREMTRVANQYGAINLAQGFRTSPCRRP